MKIFLINLARATERLDKMDRQFKVLDIVYERLDATDGASITRTDRALVDDERRKRFTEYPLSDNEIGCWLSHRRAMLALISSGEEMAGVVEDDAELSPEFAAVLKAIEQRKPKFDFIFLHRKFKKNEKFYPVMPLLPDLHLGVVGYAHMGAIAYIVSREGAQKFLQYATRKAEVKKTFALTRWYILFSAIFHKIKNGGNTALCLQSGHSLHDASIASRLENSSNFQAQSIDAPRFIHAVDKEIHRYWANGLKIYGLERPVAITNDSGYSYIEETRLQNNNKPARLRYHDSKMLSQRLLRRLMRISESMRKHSRFYFYLRALRRMRS